MLMNDREKIVNFVRNCKTPWAWIDIITTMGPTKLQNFFGELFSGRVYNHWSPTTPEGYLEINSSKNIVIHWLVGEKDKIVNLYCLDDVDFDRIDKSLSSTIIQNSVIRILSENF